MKRFLSTIAKLALTALVLFFVFRQFQEHWPGIKAYQWQLDPVWAVASLILGIFALYLHSNLWRPIIRCLGHDISGPTAFRILYLANLGRYIPGKVWQLFGILYLAKKEGISIDKAGASFVLMQMFSLPASALVFLVAAQFESRILTDQVALLSQESGWALGVAMLLISGYIVFFPRKAVSNINWILGKMKRPAIELVIEKWTALKIFLGFCLAWAVYGLAFWLLTLSVSSSMKVGPVAAIGIFILAHQIGYLAIFAPGGLGPRELIMQLLLVPFLGPIAPAMVVVARVWSLLLDSLAAALALALRKQS